MTIAEVLVHRAVPTTFSYLLPDELSLQEGAAVTIPLGRSQATGTIVKFSDSTDTAKLKPIAGLAEDTPSLNKEFLAMIPWFSQTYLCSLYASYDTIIGKKKLRDLEAPEESETVTTPLNPTEEQETVINTLKQANAFHEYLIHGVTASGKTEVYLQFSQTILDKNKTILFLIPEIALTPQLSEQFINRFGNKVALLHSGLTKKQKELAWSRIYNKEAQIVIGPRSAIFAPLDNIGAIIMDECHDQSYKQDNHPRYHTQRIAQWRANFHNCPLIYGSATPTVEQYYLSSLDNPSISLMELTQRVNKSEMPEVTVIDLKTQPPQKSTLISDHLIKKIETTLEQNEKILILVNRRGYAPYVMCQKCKHILECPECNLSYTYHKDHTFRCHRCHITKPLTNTCPKCHKKSLSFSGLGTQKVELECKRLFPNTTIQRLDKDTASTAKKCEKILKDFKKSGQLLIGTQMIAKGHDIPAVTLVGVLAIDNILNIPDYKSPERTFQLLTQVAGRAGRADKLGQVIIETYQPDHYAIKAAQTHNFKEFYEQEIQYRKALKYPPYGDVVNIVVSNPYPSNIQKTINDIHKRIQLLNQNTFNEELAILPPTPCPIERIKNTWRWHILIKCPKNHLDALKEKLWFLHEYPKTIRIIPDFDPWNLL